MTEHNRRSSYSTSPRTKLLCASAAGHGHGRLLTTDWALHVAVSYQTHISSLVAKHPPVGRVNRQPTKSTLCFPSYRTVLLYRASRPWAKCQNGHSNCICFCIYHCTRPVSTSILAAVPEPAQELQAFPGDYYTQHCCLRRESSSHSASSKHPPGEQTKGQATRQITANTTQPATTSRQPPTPTAGTRSRCQPATFAWAVVELQYSRLRSRQSSLFSRQSLP